MVARLGGGRTMKLLQQVAIGVLVAAAAGTFCDAVVPERFRPVVLPKAAPKTDSGVRAAPALPEWVRSVERTGPSLIVTIDVTSHWRGQIVGALGKRVLELADDHRHGDFPIPPAVENVLIYGNVDLFDARGRNPQSETVIRSMFPVRNFAAAASPDHDNWSVFDLAAHTNETRVSAVNGLLDGFCTTRFGPRAGDLCR